MIAIKNGVRWLTGELAMMHATLVVSSVCDEFKVDCVVTCGIEQHQHPSMHAYGAAIDYRIRDITTMDSKRLFANVVRERLGDGFDVVLERRHLHVEYDPKD